MKEVNMKEVKMKNKNKRNDEEETEAILSSFLLFFVTSSSFVSVLF